MKRLLAGLFVATLGVATVAPIAEATHYSSYRSGYGRHHFDPVHRALQRGEPVLLNNYYDGHRYRDANRLIPPSAVRVLRVDFDGTYRILFRGNVYEGYVRHYRDKLCLYLGTAPTRPGYRYELVLG